MAAADWLWAPEYPWPAYPWDEVLEGAAGEPGWALTSAPDWELPSALEIGPWEWALGLE